MRKYNNVARLRHFCGSNSLGTIFGSFWQVHLPDTFRRLHCVHLAVTDVAGLSRDPTLWAMKINHPPGSPTGRFVAFTAAPCSIGRRNQALHSSPGRAQTVKLTQGNADDCDPPATAAAASRIDRSRSMMAGAVTPAIYVHDRGICQLAAFVDCQGALARLNRHIAEDGASLGALPAWRFVSNRRVALRGPSENW
jgi:hypothetical protein